MSVVVKLVIESYTKELYSFKQSDGIASNTYETYCPVPIPGEHDICQSGHFKAGFQLP